jgi:ArsR family transcriptional regulator, arsenate/arsenite/antimonite-responsive transcriptional repressor
MSMVEGPSISSNKNTLKLIGIVELPLSESNDPEIRMIFYDSIILTLDFLKPISYYYDIIVMGTSKKEAFNKNQNRLADLAKALAHPARIAILEFLAKQNACMCGDIVEELPLSQATVSQHLAELKRIGLIKGTIEGPKVCYCINPKAWQEAKQLLGRFLSDAKSCC